MIITLYYVEGISRIDTPYFATKTSQATLSKQEEFFSNHIVQQLETAYYPPHYHNTIRFDTEDLTFNDSVNYLSLEYNGKTYYYFIDDVTYISESLIEVDITMDVIQTYMFDIYISNGIIERKFINRWKKHSNTVYYINRDYIRENISSNEFIITTKEYINTEYRNYILFVKQSKYDKSNTYGNICPRNVVSYWLNSTTLAQHFPVSLAVPYDIKFGPGSPYGFIKDDANKAAYNTYLVATGSYLAETLDMYVCPFNPFKDINISSPSSGNCTLSGNVTNTEYLNFDDMHGETVYYNKALYDTYNLAIKHHSISFTSRFYRNTDITAHFKASRIPQMLDDNYMRLTFGTDACCTTYPLYTIYKTPYLYGHYAFDITNGSRIYFISDNDTSDTDYYNTMVIDTNILSVDLKNTPWAQYIANNKNRWAQLNMNNIASISQAGATYAGSTSKIGKIGVDRISNTSYTYSKIQGRNKKGQYTSSALRKTATNRVDSSRDVYGEVPTQGNASTLAGAVIGAGNNIMQQYYTEKNLLAAPSTLSQLGECINGLLSQSHLIFKQIEEVIDYTQCGNYYHRNGFLINEHINAKSDIFGYISTRYYFNIIKMSIAEVHLHHVIEDETTVEEIKARLNDGVRLWNIRNTGVTIGDFQYDNVEYDFLS